MANEVELIFELLANDKVSPSLDKIKGKARLTAGGIDKLNTNFLNTAKIADGVDSIVGDLGKTFAFLGASVATFATGFTLNRAVNEAERLENALIGLKSIAGAFGVDIKTVEQAAIDLAADGLIPVEQVAESLKNLLSTGAGLDKAVEGFKAIRDSAAFGRTGTLSLGQAVVGTTSGVKNLNSAMSDNGGITTNLSEFQKRFAKSVGRSVGSLSNQEKQLASLNGIIRESSLVQGDYNRLQKNFSGITARSAGSMKTLLAEIGLFITRSPAVLSFINDTADTFEKFRKILKENTPAIRGFVEEFFTGFGQAFEVGVFFFEGMILAVKEFIPVFKTAFGIAVEIVGDLSDAFRKSLPKIIGALQFFGEAAIGIFKGLSAAVGAFFPGFSAAVGGAAEIIKNSFKGGTIENIFSLGESNVELNKYGTRFEQLNGQIKKATGNIAEFVKKGPKDFKIDISLDEKSFKKDFKKITVEQQKTSGEELKKIEQRRNQALKSSFSSFLGGLKQGAEGVVGAVSGIASAVGNFFLPGLGAAFGTAIQFLAQSKEAINEQINAFIEALPEVIIRIAENLPDALVAFADALARKAPAIANALARAMPLVGITLAQQMPIVAATFATSLIAQAPSIGKAIVEGAIKATGQGIGNIASSGGGLLSGVGKVFGFQKGGEIPPGFPGDTFPLLATSGENVINRDLSNRLDRFLQGNGGGGNDRELTSVLAQINNTLQQPVIATGQIMSIDDRAFAEQQLRISRSNIRTS